MEEDSASTMSNDDASVKSTSPSPLPINSKGIPLAGVNCAVCKENCVPGILYRRHYGVICCEACKCFFRRTVQMNRDYKCRFGGCCYIGKTTENFKQMCQACRFNQCIQAGMRLESVKKFPRTARSLKIKQQVDGITGTPSLHFGKSLKGSGTKLNQKKNDPQHQSAGTEKLIGANSGSKINGSTGHDRTAHPHRDHLSSVGGVLLSPGSTMSQNKELVLSDTDFENVKFKLSTSEAMLYLQSSSTTISQLFKYDSLDGTPTTDSPANLENSGMGMEVGNGHDTNSVLGGYVLNPSPVAVPGGVNMKPSSRTGINGCRHHSRRGLSLPGKRGPEEAARARRERKEEDELDSENRYMTVIPRKKLLLTSSEVGMSIGCDRMGPTHYSHARLPSHGSLSTPPLTPISPSQSSQHSHSHPSSGFNSPEPAVAAIETLSAKAAICGVSNSMNACRSTSATSHCVTSDGSPAHTPYQSPLQSPLYNSPHSLPTPTFILPPPASFINTATPSVSGKVLPKDKLPTGQLDMTATPQASNYLAALPTPTLNPLNVPAYGAATGGFFPFQQHHSNPVVPATHSGKTLPTNNLTASQLAGAILLNSQHTSMPFRVLTPAATLLPASMVISPHPPPHTPQLGMGIALGGTSLLGRHSILSSKSPFRIVPIPSINRTQPPEELPNELDVVKVCCDSPNGQGDLTTGGIQSSLSGSPVQSKPKTFNHLAEAKLEEVLDSLRIRIRSLFTWAKSDVSGFDDLSPLDQKALLRRTVPELVMLGFARGSIAYDNLLLLGRTGKVIRPNNQNSGVASVASVTLQKLVVPLKGLNINDRELSLLKEIVLFNPESNGLRNREVVRQCRKHKHLKLMEYTEKSSNDISRFGELMCLLTPLFEVSTEVTEQLRLEQFVHEGEARIDALLLMSMINVADEIPDVNTLGSQL